MRRIVMFTPGHCEAGGVAQRSRLFASELAARGWNVRVVTRAATESRFRLTRAQNLRVIEVPGWGSRWLGAALYALAAAPLGVMWGRKPSLFFAVQFAATSTVAGLIARLLGRPFVALSSTSGDLSEVAHVRDGRLRPIRHGALKTASFLVAQTPGGARELEALAPARKITTIPNPVLSIDDPPPLNGLPRVVYSGRFSREKDLPRLLRAWRATCVDRRDATLTLVGAGGDYRSVEAELRALIACDETLSATVRLPGWVDDVGQFLREADVYVFPTLAEGMSNALLEACAWHRVVVASDIEPNRAVLGDDYPLLYRAGDTDHLALALESALGDDALRRQALGHIKRRLPSFEVDTVVDRLEATMAAAISNRVEHSPGPG